MNTLFDLKNTSESRDEEEIQEADPIWCDWNLKPKENFQELARVSRKANLSVVGKKKNHTLNGLVKLLESNPTKHRMKAWNKYGWGLFEGALKVLTQ